MLISRSIMRALVALPVFIVPGAANATAIFAGSAEATLTITSVTNLTTPGDLADLFIEGDAIVSFTNAVPEGTAGASADGDAQVVGADPFDLVAGDGLFQRSTATGFADPVGLAVAEHLTDGILYLDNFSATDTFEIAFLLAFSLSASASAGNPATEFALAEAYLELSQDSGPLIAVYELLADSDTTPSPESIVDEIAFAITLGPDAFDALIMLVDADGGANGVFVPEPRSSILLLLGLILIAAARKLEA